MKKTIVNVLDKGYVLYKDHMGDDLTIVNAARASFEKESLEFNSKDARLLHFLGKEQHNSPLRHAVMTFECYAPLMVARQWFKYAVASTHVDNQFGWNESSRRYVTEKPQFYIPKATEWRSAPENKKQGSGKTLIEEYGAKWTDGLEEIVKKSEEWYDAAIQWGIAPEQARLFLPAYGLYVRWWWTASLGAVMHFLNQRLADDAQIEIQRYAKAVKELTAGKFPATVKEFVE